ncbi:MAG: hypothetical protein AAF583_02755 [Pseudomonadota bacterium]
MKPTGLDRARFQRSGFTAGVYALLFRFSNSSRLTFFDMIKLNIRDPNQNPGKDLSNSIGDIQALSHGHEENLRRKRPQQSKENDR